MTRSAFAGAQFPEGKAVSRSGRRRVWVDWLLLWVVVGGAATIRTHSVAGIPSTVLVVALTVALCALLVRRPQMGDRLRQRWVGALVAAVMLALVSVGVAFLGGILAGSMAVIGGVAGLLLAAQPFGGSGVARERPVAVQSPPGFVVALMLIAGQLGTTSGRALWAISSAGAGLVVVVLATVMPRRAKVWGDAIVRVLRELLHLVSLLAIGALWCVTIGPAWVLDRVTGWDPLAQWQGTGWVQRAFDPSLRPWSRQRGMVVISGAVRLRRNLHRGVVSVLTVLAVLAAGVVGVRQLVETRPPDVSSPAMSTSPWYPEVASVTQDLLVRQRFNSFLGYELPDVTSRYVNVTDGRRHTWQPPAGPCRAVQMWMFGGSTTFGDGQRDEYTIPSQLAKFAWSEGIPVEVSNYAAFGDTAWIGSRRLEAALSVDSDEPDLVVFLDGFNEYRTRVEMIDGGHSGDDVAVSYLDSQLFPLINRLSSAFWGTFRPSEHVHDPQIESVTIDDPEVLGQLIGRQYRIGVEASQRQLSSRSIDAVWFDQPSVYTLSDPPSGTPLPANDAMDFGRSSLRAMRAVLPDEMVDITSAIDGETTPVYRDEIHTNERGAQLVAQAMFEELRPTLENLCQESEHAVDPTQRPPGD